MVKRDTHRTATYEELVEGVPASHEPAEKRSHLDVITVPAVRLPSRGGPAGETGMIPAVRFSAESDDRAEGQDASRTTAENRAVPVSDADISANGHMDPLVLIIEDSFELAQLIQITLKRNHIRSVIETSGSRALERYREMKPDVVLLDLGLPDMTGWKVLDEIRETSQADGTMPIVIVVSAYGDAANRLVGKLQNVHGYLVKPFTSEDIIRAVRQSLNGKAP
jgi:CheY-like chemotaxis protein